MSRLTALAATAVLIGLSLTPYDAPARAADPVPTCDGKPATIVGGPDQPFDLQGTPGDDVIVTDGAEGVAAGAGDDTICVTGKIQDELVFRVGVVAGPGSDHVDTTASQDPSDVYLGDTGRSVTPIVSDDVDTFVGGPLVDLVDDPGGETVDIDTGAGDDRVTSEGDDTRATIDLGPGDDGFAEAAEAMPGGPVQVVGGGGTNTLSLVSQTAQPGPSAWRVDDAAHVASRDGVTAFGWSNFTHFVLEATNARTRFVGGAAAETLIDGLLGDQGHPGTIVAAMGAGNDTVEVHAGDIDAEGGPGRDLVQISAVEYRTAPNGYRTQYVHLDLARGTVGFGPQKSQQMSGFEDADVSAATPVVVQGTAGPNRISVATTNCTSTTHGGGGDDLLTQVAGGDCGRPARQHWLLDGGPGDDVLHGRAGDDVLQGGPGDDRLIGNAGDDVLSGGPGQDFAGGGPGEDTCHAERTASCEH